jgi:hypothetical protein
MMTRSPHVAEKLTGRGFDLRLGQRAVLRFLSRDDLRQAIRHVVRHRVRRAEGRRAVPVAAVPVSGAVRW